MKFYLMVIRRFRLWRICRRLGIKPFPWQKSFALLQTDRLDAQPPEQSEGQLATSGWMPGEMFPRQPCEVVADLRAAGENGKPDACIRRICWFDGTNFLFKRDGPNLDAECVRWMVLPPAEDNVSKLDTNTGEEAQT